MPLNIPTPPPASLSALAGILPGLAARPGIAAQLPSLGAMSLRFADAPTQAATPTLSMRGYTLGLDAIAAGRDLSAARLAVWTHLLPGGGGGQALAADTTAESSEFAQLTDGPHAAALQEQVAALQADPAVAKGSYDLALLRVPALFTVAVWLQGKGGSADVVVPVAPADPAVQPGRHYSAAEFIAALAPSARQKLADTDPRKGG